MNKQELQLYALQSMRNGSKTFMFATHFLSRKTQLGVVLFYSWCRFCDDYIDNAESSVQAKVRIDILKSVTSQILSFNHSSQSEVESKNFIIQGENDLRERPEFIALQNV